MNKLLIYPLAMVRVKDLEPPFASHHLFASYVCKIFGTISRLSLLESFLCLFVINFYRY